MGSFGIHFCLEVPEETRSILHLVNDYMRGMALEEDARLLFGLFNLCG